MSAGETAEGFVDINIPGVAEGTITVSATSSASADADSAEATGLALRLSFSGALFGQSVALELGTITLAETACTVGAPDTTTSTTPGATTSTTPGATTSTTPGATPGGGELPQTR